MRDSEVLLLLEHSVAEDQPAVWSFLAPQRMMQYRPLLSLEHHLSNNVVLCCPLPARAYSALMEAEKQLALCFQHPAGPSTCFGDQIKEDGAKGGRGGVVTDLEEVSVPLVTSTSQNLCGSDT